MSVQRARQLRSVTTDAERRLWRILRIFRHEGLHFRRQAPIGPYVADFACHRAKLIVELDGSQHAEARNARHDAVRTAFLESRGYRVLRFANSDLVANRENIAEYIFVEASARLHPPPKPASTV